jgi:hypothetical protein
MAGRPKGSARPEKAGRVAGTPNKPRAAMMSLLQKRWGDDFHPVLKMAEAAVEMHRIAMSTKDMEDLKDAVSAWAAIAKYIVPQIKAVEVDVTSGGKDLPRIIELVAPPQNAD